MASLYRETLDKMGVEISISKSLISFSGAAEFAKKFRCRNLTVDLSPVSIRNLLNSHHLPGALSLLNTYSIQRFSTLARLHGAGFKVLSRLTHSMSARYQRLRAVWEKYAFRVLVRSWETSRPLPSGIPHLDSP